MVERLIEELRRPISVARLEGYRSTNGSNLDMIANYFWNIELCKGFYTSLNALEIALRNAIHEAAVREYEDDFWFDHTDVLLTHQIENIVAARDKLASHNKPQGADDIVAALTLGFWISLFSRPFEPKPASPRDEPVPAARLRWQDEHSRPTQLFHDTFPYAPRQAQSRKVISRRGNRIRWLRNRVMHHEPIWKYRNLPALHEQIIEMVGWISPPMRDASALCDDFIAVHAGGRPIIAAKLERYLAEA